MGVRGAPRTGEGLPGGNTKPMLVRNLRHSHFLGQDRTVRLLLHLLRDAECRLLHRKQHRLLRTDRSGYSP